MAVVEAEAGVPVVRDPSERLSARIVRATTRLPVHIFLLFVGVLWLVPTIGLFLTTTHFVLKWFGPKDVGFFSASEPGRPWAAALSYTVYGLVLILIGLWLARRRPPAEPL